MARPKPKAKPKAKTQAKKVTQAKPKSVVGKVAQKGVQAILGGSKKGSGGKKSKSARVLLKRAYEKRAKRQIRLGQLGQAKRTLLKKATVIG